MKAKMIVVAVLALLLGAVQAASLSLFGRLGGPGSVPPHVVGTWPFGVAAATGLDRSPAIRLELARGAFIQGDGARADQELAGLPPRPDSEDLRGRIAQARGDLPAAIAAYAAAGDGARGRDVVLAIAAQGDTATAFRLATSLLAGLEQGGNPPAVIAEAAWRAGTLAAALANAGGAQRLRRVAVERYAQATRLDPDQETYWLNLGFETLALGERSTARQAYERAAALAPAGVDGLVGLAVSSAALGACTASRRAINEARLQAARQHRSADPGAAGFGPKVIAALAAC